MLARFASALVLLRPPELGRREALAPETRAELLGPRLTFSRTQNARSVCQCVRVCNVPFRAVCPFGRCALSAALPFRLAHTADSEYPHGTVPCTACCTLRRAAEAAAPHRLITRRTYEAEMFDRAAKKIGLDQALFGGSQVGRTRRASIAHATHETCNI